MGLLSSRKSLADLEQNGVFIDDLPGLALDGKPLFFLHFAVFSPTAPLPTLGQMKPVVEQALKDFQETGQGPALHLYYLDDRGQGLLSVRRDLEGNLLLPIGDNIIKAEPLQELTLFRRYEAIGTQGQRQITYLEKKSVFTAIEKFLGTFTQGWGTLFSNRDPEDRVKLFRDFQPKKIGLFNPEERLDNLVLRMKMGIDANEREIHFFKELELVVPEASLDEVLKLT